MPTRLLVRARQRASIAPERNDLGYGLRILLDQHVSSDERARGFACAHDMANPTAVRSNEFLPRSEKAKLVIQVRADPLQRGVFEYGSLAR